MAITAFGTNDAQTRKVWSDKLFIYTMPKLFFWRFLGKSENSIIQFFTDLSKGRGDEIKYDLLAKMTSEGVSGSNTLEGNEEDLTYHGDAFKIDQHRFAHAFYRLARQFTVHELCDDARFNLGNRWKEYLDTMMFRYLCADATVAHAGNSVTTPDTDHYLLSGDVAQGTVLATQEASLGSDDVFRLEDIDYAKEMAQTIEPRIEPALVDGENAYFMVLHPYSVVDLRQNVAGSTKISWPEIQQNAAARGSKNPIFTGALGMYNNVWLYESNYIYSPINNVRRNLFLGRQAGVFGLGNPYKRAMEAGKSGPTYMNWWEQSKDYGEKEGVAVGATFGMKDTAFNDKNFGKIIVSSYAAKHTG